MALTGALVVLQLKGLVRSGRLRNVALIAMLIMAASYALRLISWQTALSEYEPQLVGKSLFQEMSIIQAFLINFILIWFYPQGEENSIRGLTTALYHPELTERRIIFTRTVSALIYTGIIISLLLPFAAVAFLLGGVDMEGMARISLYFMVLGVITPSIKNLWYSLTRYELLASALSLLTTLGFTALKIYADLLTPGGSNKSLFFHVMKMFSPWPDFTGESLSFIPWSAISGRLVIGIFLFLIRKID